MGLRGVVICVFAFAKKLAGLYYIVIVCEFFVREL